MADPEFEVLRKNADWAETFGGASTNLAQRHRYAQDREALARDLLSQQEAHLAEEARRNKTAQNFYFRQKDAERRDTLSNFERTIKQQKADWEDKMMPLRMESERAKADALRASETARLNKEKRDAEQALRVVKDSDSFENGVHSLLQQHRPGSREFADGVLELTSKHPFVPTDLRKTWLKQADIADDADTLMTQMGKFKDTHNIGLALNSEGKWSATAKPKVIGKTDAGVGTISTTTKDEDGTRTTVKQPFTPDLKRQQLEADHAVAEAAMRKSAGTLLGKPDPTTVGALNAIKSKLGYDLLDSTTGQVIPKTAPVVAPATVPPVGAPVASTSAPVIASTTTTDTAAQATTQQSAKPKTIRQAGITYTLGDDGEYR